MLLALFDQCWSSTTGLVPEFVLQDLDCRIFCSHNLYAPSHDLYPFRPHNGASVPDELPFGALGLPQRDLFSVKPSPFWLVV